MTQTIQQVDPPPPTEPVSEDLACFRCGYNARGLPPGGQCPECGASIAEMLRRRAAQLLDELPLDMSHPRWVRKLAWACALLLAAAAGLVLVQVITLLPLSVPVAIAGPLIATPFVLLTAGLWLSGAQEPHRPEPRALSLRRMIRIVTVCWALVFAGMMVTLASGSFDLLAWSTRAHVVVCGVSSWCFFIYMQRLARRLNRPRLGRVLLALAWLALVTCIATSLSEWEGIEVRPDAYHMSLPMPVIGDCMMLVLLPYSLRNIPRFDAEVVLWAWVAVLTIASLVALAMLHHALRRAAARSREGRAREQVRSHVVFGAKGACPSSQLTHWSRPRPIDNLMMNCGAGHATTTCTG